ncbi:Protein argonaute 1A [Hordeum vulgare]|nr:Protein argonaute 1A [Hordeum vulgare]
MHEIIMSGSIAVASYPGIRHAGKTMDTIGDIDDKLDDAEEGGGGRAGEGGIENSAEKEGRKKKRASNAKPAEPRVKWTSNEDECLAEAWKTVNIDPITDVNQNIDTYCGRIKTVFHERKIVDPDFVNIHMDRGEKAMSNHWSVIQTDCNMWHGIVEEVAARPETGTNIEGQMVRMFAMYRTNNEDQEFKFLHVFSKIKSCESGGKFGSLSTRRRTRTIRTRLPRLRQKGASMAPKKPRQRGKRHPVRNGRNLLSSNASPTPREILPGGRRNPTRSEIISSHFRLADLAQFIETRSVNQARAQVVAMYPNIQTFLVRLDTIVKEHTAAIQASKCKVDDLMVWLPNLERRVVNLSDTVRTYSSRLHRRAHRAWQSKRLRLSSL